MGVNTLYLYQLLARPDLIDAAKFSAEYQAMKRACRREMFLVELYDAGQSSVSVRELEAAPLWFPCRYIQSCNGCQKNRCAAFMDIFFKYQELLYDTVLCSTSLAALSGLSLVPRCRILFETSHRRRCGMRTVRLSWECMSLRLCQAGGIPVSWVGGHKAKQARQCQW